jgi:hypothetical protein
MQRLGPAVAIAVASAVFAARGHLGTPASVTDGFRPALAACAGFALLAALSSLAITTPKTPHAPARAEDGSTARPELATADADGFMTLANPVRGGRAGAVRPRS